MAILWVWAFSYERDTPVQVFEAAHASKVNEVRREAPPGEHAAATSPSSPPSAAACLHSAASSLGLWGALWVLLAGLAAALAGVLSTPHNTFLPHSVCC